MKVEEFYRKKGSETCSYLEVQWSEKKWVSMFFCQTQLSNERYTSGYEYDEENRVAWLGR